MRITATAIPDVLEIDPTVHGDERGFFMETFRADVFARAGIKRPFVQDNHSASGRNVLRGLHYQIQQPQGKLVRVVRGSVFDVAVDLRKSSRTFGQWAGTVLSAENKRQLWVPEGFAHGFLVLEDNTEFVYKCTDYYAPEHERSLLWDDPAVAIDWPELDAPPILSAKDASAPVLEQAELFP
jgi:dTDP-4-dehydrorhamnose 3,5-epimerase